MAKKSNKKAEKEKSKKKQKKEEGGGEHFSVFATIKQETLQGIYAVIAFVIAAFFVLAAFAGAGPAGNVVYNALHNLVGWGYLLLPAIAIILAISFLRAARPNIGLAHLVAGFVLLASSLGIIDTASGTLHGGGIIGKASSAVFLSVFSRAATYLFLGALVVIALIFIFDRTPSIGSLWSTIASLWRKEEEEIEEGEAEQTPLPVPLQGYGEGAVQAPIIAKEEKRNKEEDFMAAPAVKAYRYGKYTPPPIELLERDRGKPNTGDIKANTNIIKRTLQNFGIEVEMDEVTVGPTVTRYALKPAEGVKLSKIVGLKNDLGLALAAHPIRIEAPIPGKSLVGIEIPNKAKSIVGLASLIEDVGFTASGKALTVALGRNITGRGVFASVAKMPHGLIAGATGSGKSVAIHAVVVSLLYSYGPADLKFLMIDPKRVELTLYNGIPHLLTPVITDAKKAILALKWAAREMEKRYNILEQEKVRDITSYQEKMTKDKNSEKEPMPYIVIVIDELADIMTAYPRELESAIVRLAQMSRAVGIHLILSTQRPSVNVVTGLIKANVPTRIAMQVASQIDSRTILDTPGAESLLGGGDMLYLSGEMPQPERLQGAFITEEEVKQVVKYLHGAFENEIPEEINLTNAVAPDGSIFSSTLEGDGGDDDDLYEDARQIVIETQKASTSFLQRKLGIGYARAARLIDILEERGIVSPGNGSKPREVLEKSGASEQQDYA